MFVLFNFSEEYDMIFMTIEKYYTQYSILAWGSETTKITFHSHNNYCDHFKA